MRKESKTGGNHTCFKIEYRVTVQRTPWSGVNTDTLINRKPGDKLMILQTTDFTENVFRILNKENYIL